jgi:hypothetical protein
MTLEAGKELDRRCVLNWLNEVYVTPSRAYCKYTDDELRMFAHDALVLLNEQEAEIRQLKLALDIVKGECKGISVEGR